MKNSVLATRLALWVFLLAPLLPLQAEAQPAKARVPWTTSSVTGSPEPPPPYRAERVFPKLTFKNPVLLTAAPFGKRLIVAEQGGKVWTFPNDPACEKADLLVDLAAELKLDSSQFAGFEALYGLVFHPDFAKNRLCYLCYVLNGKGKGQHPDGTRVSAFRVNSGNRIDVASEKLLVTWLAGGHNGGDLHFGNDGFLYISTGDATEPAPPDRLGTGQDISDLLSSILRIDVNHKGKDSTGKPLPYAIPGDNPFVSTPRARPEVWAYGFRNPWRMGFDRPTGDLWVGDVGWELYEMIYRVRPGGNYGWSVMEGPQSVSPEAKRGPTPILPPDISFPHTEAASITGGFVYRGKRLKELQGSYICGDWVTRKLWSTRIEHNKVVSHRELAQTGLRIIAFGLDHDQELYFLDYQEAAGVYRLAPNEIAKAEKPFPRKLSETGIFTAVKEQIPAPGVYPFQINSQRFTDHASAQRLLALPGTTTARFYDRAIPVPETFFSAQVFMPKDGVLVKTLSLPVKTGEKFVETPVETQILHFDGKTWNAYTYAWNPGQTDADLVPAAGMERELVVKAPREPEGYRKQTWRYAARTQCLTCHNPWAGYALAFNPQQLDLTAQPQGSAGLTGLKNLGLVQFRRADGDKPAETIDSQALTSPHDTGALIEKRARSYLHANCSHCHQSGAGGTATIDLRHHIPLAEAKTLGLRAVQGSFDLPAASLITPGDPLRSALYYRMAKTGAGHMPHLGADLVDEQGLALLHDWIRQLPPEAAKTDPASLASRQALGAILDAVSGLRGKTDGDAPKKAIHVLLSSSAGALALARFLDEKPPRDPVRQTAIALIPTATKPEVRDLLERFIPVDQRLKRLGSLIDPRQILSQSGNVSGGRELFTRSANLRCAACHRVDGAGSTLGPDLSGIGKKYSREQILEQLLQPSKTIDPRYATQVVETSDGKFLSGILASRSAQEIVLRTADDKELKILTGDVLSMRAQTISQMPEMLLRDLTAQQAADLLAYLASLMTPPVVPPR